MIYTDKHVHTRTHIHTCTHIAHTQTHIHIYITDTPTPTHKHSHTHTHAHTHTSVSTDPHPLSTLPQPESFCIHGKHSCVVTSVRARAQNTNPNILNNFNMEKIAIQLENTDSLKHLKKANKTQAFLFFSPKQPNNYRHLPSRQELPQSQEPWCLVSARVSFSLAAVLVSRT